MPFVWMNSLFWNLINSKEIQIIRMNPCAMAKNRIWNQLRDKINRSGAWILQFYRRLNVTLMLWYVNSWLFACLFMLWMLLRIEFNPPSVSRQESCVRTRKMKQNKITNGSITSFCLNKWQIVVVDQYVALPSSMLYTLYSFAIFFFS